MFKMIVMANKSHQLCQQLEVYELWNKILKYT